MRPRSGILVALAAVFACAAASFWITAGVAPFERDRASLWHHYEYLAEGFIHGHTYLSAEPARELLRLRDPYDPAANEPYRLWDASLYQGKYYLYYGPTPAAVLMAPWRALTGGDLPQRTAVAVFASLGMAFLGLLLWEVRGRHFPRVPGWAVAVLLVVAFHASWLPVILRRPGVWELPIVSETACLWAALYLLWRFHESGRRAAWGAAAGLALALLMGSRVTSLFACGFVALLMFVPPPGVRIAATWRPAALASAIAALGGVCLLAYNHARFGSFTEFGQSYQLWGLNERHLRHFDPAFIPFNARLYLTSVPTLSPYFPFIRGSWPDLPDGYIAVEEIQGVVFVMPVHLAGLAALAWASRARGSDAGRGLALTVGAAAAASALAALVLFCFAGACSRYIAELVCGWTFVTSVGLLVLWDRGSRAGRLLGAAAAAWTVAGVWFASAEFRGFMRQTEPRVYAAAAHALDAPSAWWIRSKAVEFGPLELDIRVPAGATGETVLVASGRPQMVDKLVVSRADGEHVRLILAENERIAVQTGPLALDQGRLVVRLDAPWLYPPAEHPYWDSVAGPERRARLRMESIAVGPQVFSGPLTHAFDAAGFEPAVRGRAAGVSDLPWVESVRRLPRSPAALP